MLLQPGDPGAAIIKDKHNSCIHFNIGRKAMEQPESDIHKDNSVIARGREPYVRDAGRSGACGLRFRKRKETAPAVSFDLLFLFPLSGRAPRRCGPGCTLTAKIPFSRGLH